VDEVIAPSETRSKLIKAFAMLENKVVNNPRKKQRAEISLRNGQ
jgi:propionyl-CoA carboxylase beta chain